MNDAASGCEAERSALGMADLELFLHLLVSKAECLHVGIFRRCSLDVEHAQDMTCCMHPWVRGRTKS